MKRGRVIALATTCGLVVTFDGSHDVSVSMPKEFGRVNTGICGTCDGKQNDLRTREGVDVSNKANRYSLIGDSYKVYDDLAKPGEK